MLLSRDQSRVGMIGRGPEASQERELSWLDSSSACDLSADGQWLLFTESGEGGGPHYGAYLRRTDGSPAVHLGEGQATTLSPDGKWALSILYGTSSELRILPTGAGEVKTVPQGSIARFHWASFLPDGSGILFTGNEAGKGLRIYAQSSSGGAARPVTPEGVGYLLPVTRDGKFVPSTPPTGACGSIPSTARASQPSSRACNRGIRCCDGVGTAGSFSCGAAVACP